MFLPRRHTRKQAKVFMLSPPRRKTKTNPVNKRIVKVLFAKAKAHFTYLPWPFESGRQQDFSHQRKIEASLAMKKIFYFNSLHRSASLRSVRLLITFSLLCVLQTIKCSYFLLLSSFPRNNREERGKKTLNNSFVKYKALELEKRSMALKKLCAKALCNRELFRLVVVFVLLVQALENRKAAWSE